MARPGRHLDFFALMELLPEPGCPVCRLADRAERRYLDTLFYEHINDSQVRAALREAGGFCRRHTARVLEAGDALGGSLLFGDLLLSGPPPQRQCPACQVGAQAAQRAVQCLVSHMLEADVAAAYQAGGVFVGNTWPRRSGLAVLWPARSCWSWKRCGRANWPRSVRRSLRSQTTCEPRRQ